MNIILIDIY